MTRHTFVIGLAVLALCGAAQADVIGNGSFETGNFVPNSQGTMVLPAGSTAMTDWEVIVGPIAWIGPGDPWAMDPAAGARFLDLTGYHDGPPYGGVRQTFTTVPGHHYRVSLSLGSSNTWGLPAGVTVSAAGAEQTFTTPATGGANDWYSHELTFVAAAASTTVSIAGSTGFAYIGLDAVSVEDLDTGVEVGAREWRQLVDTIYVTWNEVAAACPTDGVTPCGGSILRSFDGAWIDVTGWTWALSADVQGAFETIIQPEVTNLPTETSTYSGADDPDIARALSGAPDWFEPTRSDAAGRYAYGLTATTTSTDAAYRPAVRDAIPGNSDWVNLAFTLPRTSRQSYTGVWLFRPVGGALGLRSLTLKSAEVAGCKSVTGTVTLTNPAPAGGAVVTLSDTLAAATMPASVTLAAGATSKTFTVKTTAVSVRQTGAVNATLAGTTLGHDLAVRPMGLLSVSLAPTSVAGTQPVSGTAKLECKAGPGPITVDLASSNAAVAQPVAASIVVPQGLQSTPFDVTTYKVLAKTTATISATANAITRSKTLAITPAAVVSPASLKFGSVAVGDTSAPLTAAVTNRGAIPVSIDSIAVTGTYASWFPTSEDCPASLAAGASCTVSVTFKPIAAASRSAKVSVASSATALPLTVSVSGTGVASP